MCSGGYIQAMRASTQFYLTRHKVYVFVTVASQTQIGLCQTSIEGEGLDPKELRAVHLFITDRFKAVILLCFHNAHFSTFLPFKLGSSMTSCLEKSCS